MKYIHKQLNNPLGTKPYNKTRLLDRLKHNDGIKSNYKLHNNNLIICYFIIIIVILL